MTREGVDHNQESWQQRGNHRATEMWTGFETRFHFEPFFSISSFSFLMSIRGKYTTPTYLTISLWELGAAWEFGHSLRQSIQVNYSYPGKTAPTRRENPKALLFICFYSLFIFIRITRFQKEPIISWERLRSRLHLYSTARKGSVLGIKKRTTKY